MISISKARFLQLLYMDDYCKQTILVVDDDWGILEVIKTVLEEKGYGVITLSSGSKVQQCIAQILPQLILLDVWMSGADGKQITQMLKGQKTTQDIPIILISALSDVGKIAQASGADDFLAKPFDIDMLTQMVDKYARR